MAKYIALLRGVNVGQNILKMDRLRALSAALGFRNVTTYVQSGNMVFDAEEPAAACMQALEQKLARETRLPVAVLVRTPGEIKTLIARNPFLKDRAVDRARLHVTFLGGSPAHLRAGPGADRGKGRTANLRAGSPALRLKAPSPGENDSLSKLAALARGAERSSARRRPNSRGARIPRSACAGRASNTQTSIPLPARMVKMS
jgi:Protein of unknown function (DUF1697)